MGDLKPNWVAPPMWMGETAFLLGCGPSLRLLSNYPPLRRFGRVIAINDAYELCSADVLYFHDHKWWIRNQPNVRRTFSGSLIVTCNARSDNGVVKRLRCGAAIGLSQDPAVLCHGSNSGYQAINLAYHFGVRRIVLCGYDLRTVGTQVHWRPRKVEQLSLARKVLENVMLPKFSSLVEPLAKAGIEVYNATPNSALRVWPFRPLEQFLERKAVKTGQGLLGKDDGAKLAF